MKNNNRKKNNRKKNKRADVQVSPAANKSSVQDLSINNMGPFYSALSKWIPKDCPAVIVLKQLPNGECIQWQKEGNKYIAMLAEDIPDIKKLELVMAGPPATDSHFYTETIASSCPIYSEIYGFASMLSNSLSIRCPQILVFGSHYPKRCNGMLHNDGNCPMVITMKGSLSTDRTIRTLAHEMRHAWQHITNPEYFFVDYHFTADNGVDEYAQQVAEVDAEAFSRAFCHLVFGVPIQEHRFSVYTDQLINELAKKMAASPLDYGISIPGVSGVQRRSAVA